MKFNKRKFIVSIIAVIVINSIFKVIFEHYSIPIVQLHLNNLINRIFILFILWYSIDINSKGGR